MIQAKSSKLRLFFLLLVIAALATSASARSRFGKRRHKKSKNHKSQEESQPSEQNCFTPNITLALIEAPFDRSNPAQAPGGQTYVNTQQRIADAAAAAGRNFSATDGLACGNGAPSKTCNAFNNSFNVFYCLLESYNANGGAARDKTEMNRIIHNNIFNCVYKCCMQQQTPVDMLINGVLFNASPWTC